jgi:hypothetical protein
LRELFFLPSVALLLRLRVVLLADFAPVFAPDLAPLAAAERFLVVVDDLPVPVVVFLVPVADFLVPVVVFLVPVVVLRLVLDLFDPAVELPPLRPPSRDGSLFSVVPLPEPDFLPPWSVLLTVAHARFSASFELTPRFS